MLLGVNGPFPEPGAACSGYLLRTTSYFFQFDFGTGVLARLTGLMPPEDLDALFLSHWHYDHTSDLLPLVYRLEAMGRTLRVYAPVDESSPMRKILREHSCFQLTDVAPGDELTLGDCTVRVGAARHPVPAVMYRVHADGKSFCYTGDTNTIPELTDFCRDVDLLLVDGLFTDASWGESKPHLSGRLATRLAREANASKVVLTHLNPLIDPVTLLREAREERKDVLLAKPELTVDV